MKDGLIKICEIVKELRNTTKSTEKINILKNNKDNELLQKIFEYTYNPYKKYGISQKILNEMTFVINEESMYKNIFDLLNVLNKSNINDNLRREIVLFLGNVKNEEIRDLYKCVLLKDLNTGVNVKTINKIWQGLIPTFEVMTAKSYYKDNGKERIENKEFLLSLKCDGSRLCVVKENGVVSCWSRTGQSLTGFTEIEEEIKNLPVDNVFIDGECLATNEEGLNSADLFRKTRGIMGKKGNTKTGLEYHIFDMVNLEGFKKGYDATPCRERKQKIKNLLKDNKCKYLKIVKEYYTGADKKIIRPLLDKVTNEGLEGLMLNILDAPYECKRSFNIFKLKKFCSADVRCVGIKEGVGKYRGAIGSITINFCFEDNYYLVDVGSGFCDEDRVYYYIHPNEIIGHIVQINYFEVTKNKKDNNLSLRFPTFVSVREEGKVENYD